MDGEKKKRVKLKVQFHFLKRIFPLIQEYILTSFSVLKCSLVLLTVRIDSSCCKLS